MKIFLLALLLATALLSNISCECECSGPGGYVEIRLMRGGKNAVFGPDAFIQKDSIKLFILQPFEQDYDLGFPESSQTVTLFLEPNLEYFFEIGNIRTDILIATSVVTSTKGCCGDNKLNSIKRNGVEICGEDCEEVIEIEI